MYTGSGTQRSTRLAASDYNQSARQSPLPRRQTPSVEVEEDGEGEEDDGNEEDRNLYCFCQKLSYGTVGIGSLRCRYTWFMIRRPQMVGCDDDDCLYQWVMSILVPYVPPASSNSFSSSIWGALVSKNPHRVVGTVLNVSLDVIRNKQWRHRGKEGKRTLVTDVRLGLFYYHTRMLSRVTCTN